MCNAGINDNVVDCLSATMNERKLRELNGRRFQLVRVARPKGARGADDYETPADSAGREDVVYAVVDEGDKDAAEDFYMGVADPEYHIDRLGIADRRDELVKILEAVSAAVVAEARRNIAEAAAEERAAAKQEQ